MRKIVLLTLALVAILAAVVSLPGSAEAGFSVCTYKCICSVPHICCGTACKPDPNGPLQCPQVYDC
jgi:hypothetical protein